MSLENEEIKNEKPDARRLTAELLEQVTFWTACVIKCNDLSVNNGVVGDIAEGVHQIRIL